MTKYNFPEKNEFILLDTNCRRKFGFFSAAGRLVLTNRRLLFFPSFFVFRAMLLCISLLEIDSASLNSKKGMEYLVLTYHNKTYRFSLNSRGIQWLNTITRSQQYLKKGVDKSNTI